MLRRAETIDDTTSRADSWQTKPLQARPGFLIRRLHQIHVALFMEECGSEKITPVQYSILSALAQMGNVEQIALSRAVGLDTTNVADVLARLERQDMVRRRLLPQDKRRKVVTLTKAGRAVLRRIDAGAARAHARTLAALEPKARDRFVRDLARLVEVNKVVGPALLALR